jgi:hypothetical protein
VRAARFPALASDVTRRVTRHGAANAPRHGALNTPWRVTARWTP